VTTPTGEKRCASKKRKTAKNRRSGLRTSNMRKKVSTPNWDLTKGSGGAEGKNSSWTGGKGDWKEYGGGNDQIDLFFARKLKKLPKKDKIGEGKTH